AALRDQLDKMVLDIGHYVGRPISVTKFVQYVIERHGEEAKKNLKSILGFNDQNPDLFPDNLETLMRRGFQPKNRF
ncbi:hypothetical protein, partial [Arsenophonus apicola]|uniref:hypothetical protein n=1 Tax=Arsenophonus apicola TaxID=2879119 RepID=UPI0038792CDD